MASSSRAQLRGSSLCQYVPTKRSSVSDEIALIRDVLPEPLSPVRSTILGDWECICSFHLIMVSSLPTISLARFLSIGLESNGFPRRVGRSDGERSLNTIGPQHPLGFLMFTHTHALQSAN